MTVKKEQPAVVERSAAAKALRLIIVGSLGTQFSSAIAAGLFKALGPVQVSSMRLAIAAVLLCAVFRPRLTGRTRSQWTGIVVYGIAMAAMNMCLYAAIDRIPLGVAVTLDFLGPCVVALLASRRIREGACALAMFGGVALIAGPGGYFDLVGYAFGLSAAFFFAVYTVAAEKVGKADTGLSGLALSVMVASAVSLPFGIGTMSSVTTHQWLLLTVSAVVGVIIVYAVDTVAARVSSARVVGTLFSMDPVVGSLIGLIVLGQTISIPAVAGIVLVVVSGAAIVWMSGSRTKPDEG
jgi:inner membrane transporter RhtA